VFLQVMDNIQGLALEPMLPQMMPGLLKGYDSLESTVRKASVFCMVALYLNVGEALRPFLKDLPGSKVVARPHW
jgi:CLIP-associating protein 1/2